MSVWGWIITGALAWIAGAGLIVLWWQGAYRWRNRK